MGIPKSFCILIQSWSSSGQARDPKGLQAAEKGFWRQDQSRKIIWSTLLTRERNYECPGDEVFYILDFMAHCLQGR